MRNSFIFLETQEPVIASVKTRRIRYNRLLKQVGIRIKQCSSLNSNLDFVRGIAANSMISFELAKRNKLLLGKDYYILKFEDLIKNPNEIMRKLTAFLEIPFEDILLKQTQFGKVKAANSSFKEDYKEKIIDISIDRLEKYNKVTTPFERSIVAIVNKESSKSFGYTWTEQTNFRTRELYKLLFPFKYEKFSQYFKNRRSLRAWLTEIGQNSQKQLLVEKMISDWERGASFEYN